MKRTVEDAIILATKAHNGQIDMDGDSYIYHPLRVMLAINIKNIDAQIVAVLHDAVEDTALTLDDLREGGYSDDIVEAIDAISKREGESYKNYLKRVKLSSLAWLVKIEDVKDNLNRSTANFCESEFGTKLSKKYDKFRRKYADALAILLTDEEEKEEEPK